MKLKVRNSQIVHTNCDEFEGGGIGIDAENMHMVMQMASQYSDVISSIVREVSSNGLDAHTEAIMIPSATDKQLIKWHHTGDLDKVREYFSKWKNRNVRVTVRAGNPVTGATSQLEVQDFGVGMSPKRMNKIFRKFFSSTKRDTNKLIGAYGLGSKSPLGYCDIFSVTTIYFGMKYEYVVVAGTERPELKLLKKYETDEINGTTFSVPIKDNRDVELFQKAVCKQLMYFDGLVIEGVSEYSKNPIIMGKHFIFREGSSDDLHICLGKVYYPLNTNHFSGLKSDGYGYPRNTNLSIGLRFEIGELDIVWNRESIEYTSETIDTIKDKIVNVKAELQDLWDADYRNLDTIEKLANAANQASTETLIVDKIPIPNTGRWIDRNVFYSPHPELGKFKNSNFLNVAISIDRNIKLGKTKQVSKFTAMNPLKEKAYLWDPINQNSDPFTNEYIYLEKNLDEFYLVSLEKLEKATKLMVSTCIKLDSKSSPLYGTKITRFENESEDLQKGWLEFMTEVMKYIESTIPKYERSIVPDKWVEAKKKAKKESAKANKVTRVAGQSVEVKEKKPPISSSMPYRYLRSWSKYGHYDFSWTMQNVNFANLEDSILGESINHSLPVIYATQYDRQRLIDLYTFVKGDGTFNYYWNKNRSFHGNPLFVLISKENLKILKLFPTAFTLSQYQAKMGNLLIKVKTATLICDAVNELIDADKTAMGQVQGYQQLYDKLHNYCNQYQHHSKGNFYDICKESTPLDTDIIHLLQKATAIERRFPMLAHVLTLNGHLSEAVSLEFDKYFRDKGKVSPDLYKRLAQRKRQMAEKKEAIAGILDSLNPQV